jgi:hypothetical protein
MDVPAGGGVGNAETVGELVVTDGAADGDAAGMEVSIVPEQLDETKITTKRARTPRKNRTKSARKNLIAHPLGSVSAECPP